MSSALSGIVSSVVAEFGTVRGGTFSKEVPFLDMFTVTSGEDGIPVVQLSRAALPDEYPGYCICISDSDVRVVEASASGSNASVIFRAPLYVAFYATSDGTVAGAAQRIAWEYGDETYKKGIVFTPSGLPPGIKAFGPLEPDGFEQIFIDAQTHGLLMRFWVKYQINEIRN